METGIQETIRSLLSEALQKLTLEGEIVLEHPSNLSHGDFSCNIALTLAKHAQRDPRELADTIVGAIASHEYIKNVTVAGPGFINFSLSDLFFARILSEILDSSDTWGMTQEKQGTSILLEHSSPNLFKPFHIGHLVNNTLGEVLGRLAQYTGATVTTVSFPSDISPGIAKTVWAILDKGWEKDLTIEKIGDAYVHGVEQYKASEHTKSVIDTINKSLYNQQTNTEEWAVYEQGKNLSLEYFKYITTRLGSTFDTLIFESEAEQVGKDIVHSHTPQIFEESEGATIFRGSEYGLFDNVFINSAGFGTYLTKDVGLLSIKFKQYSFDTSITVTDIEQKHHFELVKKVAELIDPVWAQKSQYIQHGRLSLTSGKISSRSGGVPLAQDILDSVRQRAYERMKENGREDNNEVAEQVAIAAVKYAIARVGMGKNIVFDIENSLSLEGDTGPYLQYTFARTQSILNKATDSQTPTFVQGEPLDKGQKVDTGEIEQLLYRFPLVVTRAARENEPHYVANYLAQIASAYNSWYAREHVLDGSETQQYKLALTKAVSVTLKNGLWILGIQAPEKM